MPMRKFKLNSELQNEHVKAYYDVLRAVEELTDYIEDIKATFESDFKYPMDLDLLDVCDTFETALSNNVPNTLDSIIAKINTLKNAVKYNK